MKLHIDISAQLVWSIANIEASVAGYSNIHPIHFFLGILKFIDPHFYKRLHAFGISDGERDDFERISKQIVQYLEMQHADVVRLRRSIRGKLKSKKRAHIDYRLLHRSEDSRNVFELAKKKAIEAGETAFSAIHLTEALFESECINIESINEE